MAYVEIPALVAAGQEIFPKFWLATAIDNWGDDPATAGRQTPTLAQLNHAYQTSIEIKSSIISEAKKGEWTADIVDYDIVIPAETIVPQDYVLIEWVQRPERVFSHKGSWKCEGGIRTRIELPPSGWVIPDGETLYRKDTGTPIKTTLQRDKAIEVLSKIIDREDAEKELSFFSRADQGEMSRAVLRECGLLGPFSIVTYYVPSQWMPRNGFRLCSCHKPN